MAKAEEVENRATQDHILMQPINYQRDLLKSLHSRKCSPGKSEDPTEDSGEIELSLGLSLNGQFGVDPKATMLRRYSSIPDLTNHVNGEDPARFIPGSEPLVRACSLPTESEEEWRKRKELQSQRRMEAKRKRSEKQRNYRAAKNQSGGGVEENEEESKGGDENQQQKQCVKGLNGFSRIPSWVSAPRGANGVELNGRKGNGFGSNFFDGLPPRPPSLQGSIGSQGSGSSGVSDSYCQQPIEQAVNNKSTEVKSPASIQSLPDCEQKCDVDPGLTKVEKPGNVMGVEMKTPTGTHGVAENGGKEALRNVLEDMPSVSTKGDGPNGKRIEGFLYRYRKGEEVRIVCVCHGSFLTPAEFVKHAGGGDVANPLKHIVVNPASLL